MILLFSVFLKSTTSTYANTQTHMWVQVFSLHLDFCDSFPSAVEENVLRCNPANSIKYSLCIRCYYEGFLCSTVKSILIRIYTEVDAAFGRLVNSTIAMIAW